LSNDDPALAAPAESTTVGTPQGLLLRFNNPPGWPPRPAGWAPPSGWEPDPKWPAAPYGWPLWVPLQAGDPRVTGDLLVSQIASKHAADGHPVAGVSAIAVATETETGPDSPGQANRSRRWWLFPTLALSLLLILIAAGVWLLTSATGGGHKVAASSTQKHRATQSQYPSPKLSVTPSKSSTPVDWRNHEYTIGSQSCITNGTAQLINGTGTTGAVTVSISKTIAGHFTGNNAQDVAVLLLCTAGASGGGSEMQVFTTHGTLLQRLVPPVGPDSSAGVRPEFDTAGISVVNSAGSPNTTLSTGIYSWAAGDEHCCPSQHAVYGWRWNGTAFVSALDHVVTPTAAPTIQSVPVPVPQPVTISCDNVSFTPGQGSDSGAFQIFATNTDCATAQDLASSRSTGSVPVGGYDFSCTNVQGPAHSLPSLAYTCRDPYGRVVTWNAT
jgi:hypothetical protein